MHLRPIVTILLAAPLALSIAACDGGDASSGSTPASAAPELAFTDVSLDSGLVLVNVSGDLFEKMAIVENLGQGAAALDYDGDGLMDLFVANGDAFPDTVRKEPRNSALYRNLGGLRFEDVTAAAGISVEEWAHGTQAVDFDADGHPDLYVTVFNGPNRFLRNRGNGTFEDAGARWGGADDGPSTASAFFDADGDGDLDLYVGNYVHYDHDNPPNQGRPCDWKGLSVSCGPRGTEPAADTFWENRDGALVEASEAFGFRDVPAAYTLGLVTGDFDQDGDVDLYVANDSVGNYFFERREDRFVETGLELGVSMSESGRPQAGMGVESGDIDNDGRLDLFVTNFSHDVNTLYHNEVVGNGMMLFSDDTYILDLGQASFDKLSWGTLIEDLDRDGWPDIVVVSGHVYPQVDGAGLGTSYRQPNQVFRNLGPDSGGRLRFVVASGPADLNAAGPKVSRGLVSADLDNDGDIDLLVVEMDTRPTLLRNDTRNPGAWIGFRLQGAGGNRDAIGARLEVTDATGATRVRERASGRSYLSSPDPRLVVGLGRASGPVQRVRVRWPSGATLEASVLETGRYYLLDEATGQATPMP